MTASAWPRRPWPKPPERDDAWLSKALRAEMLRRSLPILATRGDVFWAAGWCAGKLGCGVTVFFHDSGVVEVWPSVECPTAEAGALWIALEEHTPAVVTVVVGRSRGAA